MTARTLRMLGTSLLALVLLLGLATDGAEAGPRGPRLAVSASHVTFPTQGGEATLTVTNAGDQPLSLREARVVHRSQGLVGFGVEAFQPQALPPGTTFDVKVSWHPNLPLGGPGVPRQAFGALQLVSNDKTAPLDTDPDTGARITGVALQAGDAFPWLSLIVFFPLLGIPLVLLVPSGRETLVRWVALGVTLVPLGLALALASRFDPQQRVAAGNHGLQFVEHRIWIGAFNVEYFLGVDGLSIAMLLLTTLVTVIAVGASWSIPLASRVRGYFALLLLLEVGMTGVFVALDFFLFYVLWEVMLLPMYFLIGLWGGPRREYAAIKFFLYTLLGSVLMLLAVIALYYASGPAVLADGTPAAHTFDMLALTHGNDFAGAAPILGLPFSKVVWALLFVAFAIKVPVVPFHTWLPDAHVEAPTAISVILAGVLLKMGVYGLVRINWSMLPEGTAWAADVVAWLGVASIVYGSLCAMAQTDLKRLVAYSSVGHMGFCLLGLSALTRVGISGALLQMFNHGTITSMLFLLVGVLYDRTHSRALGDFGGVAQVLPRYAALFGLAFMASLGLPGLAGFIGEVLTLIGAFPVHPGLVIAAAGAAILVAAYHLGAIQKILLGPFNERWRAELDGRDLTAREALTLLPLATLVVLFGLWPAPLLRAIGSSVTDLVATVTGK
jgi:NADH-quinone oxidoreductase subunit M